MAHDGLSRNPLPVCMSSEREDNGGVANSESAP